MSFPYNVRALLNPFNWIEEFKFERQRKQRGWADRDAWGMGEHIARITVEMLELLRDKGNTDWDSWFKWNIEEYASYTNLQQIIDDINAYLDHEKSAWHENMSVRFEKGENNVGNWKFSNHSWYDNGTGKKLSSEEVSLRVNEWMQEEQRLYKKATEAMSFFGRHLGQFWD